MFERDFDDQFLSKEFELLIERYEEMLKGESVVFFEEDEFEMIIGYYETRQEILKAHEAINHAVLQYPFSAAFLVTRATLYFESNEYKSALNTLEKAEILDASDIEIYMTRAEVYTAMGKYKHALQTLNTAQNLASADEQDDIYLAIADVHEADENFEASFSNLVNALQLNPHNEEALNRIWFTVEINGNYEESIGLHQKLIDNDPYNHLAWYNLGQAYLGSGNNEKAAYAFDYVTVINEEYEPVYRDLGEAYYRMEKYEKAIEVFKKGMKIGEPYEELYFGLGQCYEMIKENGNARYYYRKAAHLDPYYDEAYFRIGEIYLAEGNLTDALLAFRKAIKLNEENVEYLVAFAETCYLEDNIPEAITNYEKACRLQPGNYHNWARLARCLFEHGKEIQAVDTLDEAIDHIGETAEINYTKSAYLFASGHRANAIISLEKALDLDEQKANILFEIHPPLLDDNIVCTIIEQYKS